MSQVLHYCQKCLAANPLGQEFCARCGTRLMIIVEPAAARYETAESASSNEDHLLERISALENRLTHLDTKCFRFIAPCHHTTVIVREHQDRSAM